MQNFLDPYLLLVDGSSGGLSDADIVGETTTTASSVTVVETISRGSSMDEPPRLPGDVRANRKTDWGKLLLRLQAEAKRREGKAEGGGGLGWIMDREGVLRQAEPMPAEPIACVVCSPWAPQDRAWLRESLAVIPLRAEVCEDCLRAFWEGLPKGSLRSTT